MNKKFLENIIPDDELKLFGINDEFENEDEIINTPTIKDKMYEFLSEQMDLMIAGCNKIAEEYDNDTIKQFIEEIEFDDKTWENLAILEMLGQQ